MALKHKNCGETHLVLILQKNIILTYYITWLIKYAILGLALGAISVDRSSVAALQQDADQVQKIFELFLSELSVKGILNYLWNLCE